MAALGIRNQLWKPSLRWSSTMTMAPRATSLPVPLVVGTAISGTTASVILGEPPSMVAYVLSGPSCVAAMATPLAQSMAEPPPTAMRPSQRCARYISTAARTAASVGLEGVWSNTATSRSPSASSAFCSTPAARTPASVTISGRLIPMRAHSLLNSLMAPNSNWIVVRYWMRDIERVCVRTVGFEPPNLTTGESLAHAKNPCRCRV